MNVVKVDLGSEVTNIEIVPLGDIHLGSKHFAKKEFEATLEYIKGSPERFVVLNGDLINNAIKTSVSDVYSEKLTPDEAIDKLYEYLEPIKDRILGVVSGNHCDRTYKLTGVDILKNLCYRLGLVDRYSPIANIIFISFGKSRGRENVRNTFSVYQSHGNGGGRTVGAKTNSLHRMSQIVHADIYIHSHTHTPIIFKEDYVMTSCKNKGIAMTSRLFVNTNAYEGFGGYGERMLLRPSNLEFISIKLWNDKRGKKFYSATL